MDNSRKTVVAVVSDDNKFVERIKVMCDSQSDLIVRHIQAIYALRRTMGSTELRIAIVDNLYSNKGESGSSHAIEEIKGSYPAARVLLMADTSVATSAHMLLLKKTEIPKVLKAIRYYLDMPQA